MATGRRERNVESTFNTIYYAADTFYLNPGSIVNVTWETKKPVYFDIYEGLFCCFLFLFLFFVSFLFFGFLVLVLVLVLVSVLV